MCGVIAVVRRAPTRQPPDQASLLAALDAAAAALASGPASLGSAAEHADRVDGLLRGVPGLLALLGASNLATSIAARVAAMDAVVVALESGLDAGTVPLGGRALEDVNADVVRVKDALWAIGQDRLRAAAAISELLGADRASLADPAAIGVLASVQIALSALDRLEVRGRDSAGLHLLVTGHGLDLDAPEIKALLDGRIDDPLFASSAVCTPEGHLSLVYKAAAEIGELGDNGAVLRAAVGKDELLRRALASPTVEATVLGHTRWASVGIISQANAHPLNSDEDGDAHGDGEAGRPYVTAALNGDVDNYLDLRAAAGLRIAAEITTDAKIIPTLISRRLAAGLTLDDAFRETAASFEGSVAVAASTAGAPGRIHLALRGSGQAFYVGLAEDAFVVASEPYGLVEETATYLRMDGDATGGHVVVLDRANAGRLEGITRLTYGGVVDPVGDADIQQAHITTRDIDRAGFPHFLLKEITEAPQSFRKTLRGKITEVGGRLTVSLGEATLPEAVQARLRTGAIRRVLVIGQGTAAVAGQSVAAALEASLGRDRLAVTALPATELSGFQLVDDMSDALVVAVSQSGTTTDTNRTVDLVRRRGGAVVAIVNRRNSDLVEKADGVLYTSDGRDVEMSVASTKAFYAQIAAGFLLAIAIADCVNGDSPDAGRERARRTDALLAALRELPEALEGVLARRPQIAEAARLAPARRYWAVVGNGPNRIAAQEIRIKLSELCYKSIACDATEDKKHIDLSSEPLILVCAAGLSGAMADDVAKEVAIYRAHKATPIVIATDGENRFSAALSVIHVPVVHPTLAFVLTAMVGHLFGYEAALSVDAQARPLREARATIEEAASTVDVLNLLEWLAPRLATAAQPFFAGLAAGAYDGHLEASTAVRVAALLRYATGMLPIESYEQEYGKVGTPSALLGDLMAALTRAIDELTRPIDAIKHQAKTVTVGISRSEDGLLDLALIRELLAAGARRDHLSYRALRSLAALDPAVAEVLGYTRYRIEGTVPGEATIHVVDRGGIAVGLRSRTDANPVLRGTKHRAAEEREVSVARGHDGRTLVLVPEIKDNQVIGLDLLHVRFVDRLPAAAARAVLAGYRNRYAALADAVTEVEPEFDDDLLAEVSMFELLSQPVYVLAERWRQR
jgi:glucosamine--fructose-6-phosphate aminotransferase (isomerizing)